MIRINLLPERKTVTRYALYSSLVIFFLTIIYQMFLVKVNLDAQQMLVDLSSADHHLSELNISDDQWLADLAEIQRGYDQLQERLLILDQTRFLQLIPTLQKIVSQLSSDLYLTKIWTNPGKFFFAGQASDYQEISSWLASLPEIPSISEVFLEKCSGQEVIQFVIWVKLGDQ